MTDYSERVKSLRVCAASVQDYECDGCSYREAEDCTGNLKHDAADAIEELQKGIDALVLKLEEASEMLKKSQDKVKRLEERNKAQQERIEYYMEKQFYIDHYGNKWQTSATDVPTVAYEHGYADGFAEATQRLESKHGEWKETDMGWDGDTAWVCSVCGEPWTLIDGTPKENNMNFCPNCGAKMGVQE